MKIHFKQVCNVLSPSRSGAELGLKQPYFPLASTNMKTAILASLIAAASAFAPAQQGAKTTAQQAAKATSFEDALGAQDPLGFFDPLGLVADADQEKFDRLRYVEIKHGRICMLGVLGYLTSKY